MAKNCAEKRSQILKSSHVRIWKWANVWSFNVKFQAISCARKIMYSGNYNRNPIKIFDSWYAHTCTSANRKCILNFVIFSWENLLWARAHERILSDSSNNSMKHSRLHSKRKSGRIKILWIDSIYVDYFFPHSSRTLFSHSFNLIRKLFCKKANLRWHIRSNHTKSVKMNWK